MDMGRFRSVSKLELAAKDAAETVAGCRLRHSRSGRGADWVNNSRKVAVFINGCFWHGCPEHFKPPKRNTEFWMAKIARNMERDLAMVERLRNFGFTAYVLWEHELNIFHKNHKNQGIHRRRPHRRPKEGTV